MVSYSLRCLALLVSFCLSTTFGFLVPSPPPPPPSTSQLSMKNYNSGDVDGGHYLQGDALHRHRRRVLQLRTALDVARTHKDKKAVRRLSRAIVKAQAVDAEFAYAVALEQQDKSAESIRACLPQFQLEGLWVGKYGDTFQMVNVSYVGDVLVAHKITGGQGEHVPKGEISFSADLRPQQAVSLDPIELQDEAANQWGAQFLQRHTGMGQVAAKGYVQSQWLEGQLILVNKDYFSFAWLETGHQVFFGRPSPELTLKLLRKNDQMRRESVDMVQQRDYLERCLEETELLEDEMEVSDGIFQSHDQGYYFTAEGCFD